MSKLRVCLELGEFGGLEISLGETEKEIPYEELTKDVNIESILETICLNGVVKPEDVKIITPEEYDLNYGDEGGE